jgi:hypothetical protein
MKKVNIKKTVLSLALVLTISGLASAAFSQDLQCISVDDKTYAADAYTQSFIAAAVNRNATSCDSKSVKLAAKMTGKKINIKSATAQQTEVIVKNQEKRAEQRLGKKLKKAGLTK